MAVSESYQNFIEERLSNFDDATYRKMFGGIGVFKEKIMFGLVSKSEVLHFRTDETNAGEYEAHGKKRFMSDAKKKGMPYHEVPSEILDDKETLTAWANIAYEVALNNKK